MSSMGGCLESGEENIPPSSFLQWSIPEEQIVMGNEIDIIPSIDEPRYVDPASATFLDDDDLVIGLKSGDQFRAYPTRVLDYHEIVNDVFQDKMIAITYCPLTGTSLAWERVIDGIETTFGVSGLLFNQNLLPYDRSTGTTWSQMLGRGVRGEFNNKNLVTHPVVEMPWKIWKALYPQSEVLSTETGYDLNYDRYPLGNYRETSDLYYDVSNFDERLFAKERVLGIMEDSIATVYRSDLVNMGETINMVMDTIQEQPVMILGNRDFMVAYGLPEIDGLNDVQPLQERLPLILTDNLGNQYDLFGHAVTGPNSGMKLKTLNAYMGYFFAFGAMFPTPEIFEPDK